MLTRKALIEALQAMDSSTVLFPSWQRTNNHRGYAVEQALKALMPDTFGQHTHATKTGKLAHNPKWFIQLYTDLSWSSDDVTPDSILSALGIKDIKPSAPAPTGKYYIELRGSHGTEWAHDYEQGTSNDAMTSAKKWLAESLSCNDEEQEVLVFAMSGAELTGNETCIYQGNFDMHPYPDMWANFYGEVPAGESEPEQASYTDSSGTAHFMPDLDVTSGKSLLEQEQALLDEGFTEDDEESTPEPELESIEVCEYPYNPLCDCSKCQAMCQDDYEYTTKTGAYAPGAEYPVLEPEEYEESVLEPAQVASTSTQLLPTERKKLCEMCTTQLAEYGIDYLIHATAHSILTCADCTNAFKAEHPRALITPLVF